MAAELLEAGPGRPVRWRLPAVLVVVVLLALGAVRLDEVLRERELASLLSQVDRGQSAVLYADRRIAGTVAYSMPLLLSAAATPAVRRSLQRLVQDTAGGQVTPLVEVRTATERTRVLPWHGRQREARRAYAGYLQAQVDHVRAVSRDADALYRPQPELTRRLDAAREALLRAASGTTSRRTVRAVLDEGRRA